ncbi:RibD family protein [Sulfuriflexus sp.]|uniref:RibD family protein n=1 Tax=Sulfuriflexus sp. TaxID=2015443 RepID=UPI0028CD29E5|nr:dihydrofolate reductase family protein [Sulfuriflexus sp.]MDT8405311.1 dihydrofolate reductase family protein [Sulfuriflexus sp.]
MSASTIMQLYPAPSRECELKGIYLQASDIAEPANPQPWVYTNFITSLDGRIAIEQPLNGERSVPASITNKRDWRLYQELAARADVLLVSARFLRELMHGKAQDNLPISTAPGFSDLLEWRIQQGLSPQPAVVILSASLDLALADFCAASARSVYVATGRRADTNAVRRLEESGAKMLYAGTGREVDGKQLVEQLVNAGFYKIGSSPDVVGKIYRITPSG